MRLRQEKSGTPCGPPVRTVTSLPNANGKQESPENRAPDKVNAEIAINPDFENAHRHSKSILKVAPLWTEVFHEFAEAFAILDQGAKNENGSRNYAQAHGMEVDREDRLWWQREYLYSYNPGSGGAANGLAMQSIDQQKVKIKK
jgi:hypothetical protein